MNENIEMTVEIKVKITKQDIDDIMCTALEGGINYWASEAEVPENERVAEWGHEQISRGGKLLIHVDEPFDDDNTEVYELTLEKFLGGFKMWMMDYGRSTGVIDDGSTGELDTSCIDAADADSIVQYALFGELVFG